MSLIVRHSKPDNASIIKEVYGLCCKFTAQPLLALEWKLTILSLGIVLWATILYLSV